MKQVLRIAARLALALALVSALYLAGALIGGAIPENGAWRQAAQGVRIYVVDNGVHTDIAVPAADFADLVRPEHFADSRYARLSHLMFGWGNRDFYVNTPSWWDLRPHIAAGAMLGLGPTVLHVSWEREPVAGAGVRTLVLSAGEYARLVSYIRASFGPGPPPVRGYFANDAFYAARGRYDLFSTCNQWTGRALRHAGVRMGRWTPFPFGVMWWL